MASSFGLSFLHPWGGLRDGTNGHGEILAGSHAPPEVRQLLANKCGDCHSNQTRWPLYRRIAPASWLVESDVAEGRMHMNLSQWPQYGPENQLALLSRISAEIRTGEIPRRPYLWLHPSAQLSDSERQVVYEWSREERRLIRDSYPEMEH